MALEEFKSMVFANNPKMYKHMFPPTSEAAIDDSLIESQEFEWVVPQSEEEARALLRSIDGEI